MKKASNRYSPWCISLSWWRRATCDIDGEGARCRSRIWVFLWRELWSTRTRIHGKDDSSWETCFCKGIQACDPQVSIYREDSILGWLWYCDIFWELSRCGSKYSKNYQKNLLLSYATEIYFWLSGSLYDAISIITSSNCWSSIGSWGSKLHEATFSDGSYFHQFTKRPRSTPFFLWFWEWDSLSSNGYRSICSECVSAYRELFSLICSTLSTKTSRYHCWYISPDAWTESDSNLWKEWSDEGWDSLENQVKG